MRAKVQKFLKMIIVSSAFFIFVFASVFFITAPIRSEGKETVRTNSVIVEDAELPDGYAYFGQGEWITNSEWSGTVINIRGISGISGDSKECRIYKMNVIQTGSGPVYSIIPVFEMNGHPAAIPYDGTIFG